MKWLAAALLLAAACAAHAQEPPAWFAPSFLDIREDVAEAAKQRKRLMVYFHQDGCPYCKRLVEVNFRDPRILERLQRGFMAIDVNIFGDREVTWTDGSRMPEKRFAALLKVQFTPTLVFFDEKAQIVHRINGYLPPEEFLKAIEKPFPAADLRRPQGARPLAVMLVEPACERCDEMQRHFARPDVRRQLERLELVQLQNPSEVLTAAGRRELRSDYVPSLVFLEPGGREVFRTEAYLRPFHIAASLEYVASGAYAKEPSFQRFLHAKTEAMRARGERVDLWN